MVERATWDYLESLGVLPLVTPAEKEKVSRA